MNVSGLDVVRASPPTWPVVWPGVSRRKKEPSPKKSYAGKAPALSGVVKVTSRRFRFLTTVLALVTTSEM